MDEPTLSPPTQKALEVFGAQTATPLAQARRDAVWRSAVAATEPLPGRTTFKLVAFGLSCAAGAALMIVLLRPAPMNGKEVQASPTAQWRRTGKSVTVEMGKVRTQPRDAVAMVVTTPQLQAVVQNAAALFDVTPGATTLNVESGEVAWRAPGRSGKLNSGTSITVANEVPKLSVAPRGAPVESCIGKDAAAYETCLTAASAGGGLAAQTALYELGLLAHERGDLRESVRLFSAYAERFPEGALAPEASIGRMVDLRRDGRLGEAAAEAARFPVRFSNEPRADDVRRWAEQIP